MLNFTDTSKLLRQAYSMQPSEAPSVAGATLKFTHDGVVRSTPLIANPGVVAALHYLIEPLNPEHPVDPQALSGNDPAWLASQQAIYWMLCSGTVDIANDEEDHVVQQDGIEYELRKLSACALDMLLALANHAGREPTIC